VEKIFALKEKNEFSFVFLVTGQQQSRESHAPYDTQLADSSETGQVD
jgi:hypothetical protein